MMKIIYILIILPYLIFSKEDKPSYWIGANAGLNLNINTANFDGLPGYDCCSEGFRNQLGYSYYLGLLFKYQMLDNLKLDLRLNFKPYSGQFLETQNIGNTLVLDNASNIKTVNVLADISIDPTMTLFSLDIGTEYSILPNISLLGGFTPSYILQGSFSQNELIVQPDNVVFLDNQSKERNKFDNEDIPDLNKIQFQIFLGAAYKYTLKKDNYLNFELKYYQALTNITSVDWKLNNLFAGISYEYPIYPTKEKQILRDTIYNRDTTNLIVYNKSDEKIELVESNKKSSEIEDDEYIKKSLTINEKYNNYVFNKTDISAKMKIYGINEDGSKQYIPTITIEETESEEGFPVLPYIFYDNGKSNLNSTSQKLLTKNEADNFTENSLSWDVFQIYDNTLNIIAKRISDNSLLVELIGNRIITSNTFEDEKIIKSRLDEIRDYLTNVWSIDPKLIKTKVVDYKINNLSQNDDLYKEASRVEINSNNVKVIQPVYLKEIVKSSNPPKVGVDVSISSTKPPVKWDLQINQMNNNIRQYNGNELNFTKVWKIDDDPIPVLEDKIEFKLNAKDDFNGEAEVTEDLQIKQLTIKKKREILKNDKKLEKYSLIIFDYNSADLKETHKDVIQKVKNSIKPNSTVTIAGYADRTGELEYNKQLALRRIQAVKSLLNVEANFIFEPYGSSVLLYDNNTEVGRSLCRTVQITIETPIN